MDPDGNKNFKLDFEGGSWRFLRMGSESERHGQLFPSFSGDGSSHNLLDSLFAESRLALTRFCRMRGLSFVSVELSTDVLLSEDAARPQGIAVETLNLPAWSTEDVKRCTIGRVPSCLRAPPLGDAGRDGETPRVGDRDGEIPRAGDRARGEVLIRPTEGFFLGEVTEKSRPRLLGADGTFNVGTAEFNILLSMTKAWCGGGVEIGRAHV